MPAGSLFGLMMYARHCTGSCTVTLDQPPAPTVSVQLPGAASISISSQASLVSAPGKPQPARAVAAIQLPDGRRLEISPKGWVRAHVAYLPVSVTSVTLTYSQEQFPGEERTISSALLHIWSCSSLLAWTCHLLALHCYPILGHA